jgi:hypothetical protein
MELLPQQYIDYWFFIPNEPGGREMKVRLTAVYDNKMIFSEPWIIRLYDWQIRQAGIPIQGN